MENINLQTIQNLLESVSNISKKYEDIANNAGENFNIFSVLCMETNERYTHSSLIGELLNPKGSHGQGSVFLKYFFEEIKELKKIEEFDFENAKIIIEEYIGRINEDYTEGGFIDIVIKDNKNVVVIENKIYAPDQKKQLIRYKDYYPNSLLLYLNLFGDEPSYDSKDHLVNGEHFHIINYKTEITNWVEKCLMETVNQPVLRETLKQYLNVVKKLTNQTTNDKMSEEIINQIIKSGNIETAIEIEKNIKYLKIKIMAKFSEYLKKLASQLNLNCKFKPSNKAFGLKDTSVVFSKEGYVYDVQFYFNLDFDSLCVGISDSNDEWYHGTFRPYCEWDDLTWSEVYNKTGINSIEKALVDYFEEIEKIKN